MAREEQVRSALPVRRYDYDDESLIVADLGGPEVTADVDVLEDVVLVVVDGPRGESQYELDLPDSGVENTGITNGILTIEVNTE
ncbi:MAG: hypothetical protein ABEJ58_08995 [Halodesulfurarchaeum sp.]